MNEEFIATIREYITSKTEIEEVLKHDPDNPDLLEVRDSYNFHILC